MANPACVARYAFEDTTVALPATAIKDASAAAHSYLRALAGFSSAAT
jgi:hypothetical protein